MNPLWVQGAAQARAGGAITSPESRYQTLAWRLQGDVLQIRTSPGTKRSEIALGLPESVYFYVNASLPAYGDNVVLFRPLARKLDADAWISPFDTGGVAQGHVFLREMADGATISAFVKTHSYRLSAYVKRWLAWVGSDFRRINDYVRGKRPRKHLVSEVDLDKCTVQAWLWEARIPKKRYDGPPLEIERIFLQAGDVRRFNNWLITATMGPDKKRSLQAQFHSRHSKSRSPYYSAQRYLQGIGV